MKKENRNQNIKTKKIFLKNVKQKVKHKGHKMTIAFAISISLEFDLPFLPQTLVRSSLLALPLSYSSMVAMAALSTDCSDSRSHPSMPGGGECRESISMMWFTFPSVALNQNEQGGGDTNTLLFLFLFSFFVSICHREQWVMV